MNTVISRETSAIWRAMGTDITVELTGAPHLLGPARERLDELEGRWSRFRPDSEISRLNATPGVPVFVSADTRRLLRHGVEAWRLTGGLCDPSVLSAVIAAGYDRPFDELVDRPPAGHDNPSLAPVVPGCAGIEIDDALGAVTIPRGGGFDPGAIGKGLAADLLAEWLLDEGAAGAFVSIGGDIRMAGEPPDGDGWLIEVRTDDTGDAITRLALAGGAVATSTTQRRRWTVGTEERHHAIDPRTGRPAVTDVITATTIAADAWWAEALATELLLTLPENRPTVVGEGAAVVVTRDGTIEHLGMIEEYVR